jgi:hypothetical protein
LITYTVTVTNNGPDGAVDVALENILPSTRSGPRGRSVLAEFVSASASQGHCSGLPGPYEPTSGQTVTCDLGGMQAAGNATVTFDLALFSRSRARSPYAFHFTDSASVSSASGDPNPDNDRASATATYYMR